MKKILFLTLICSAVTTSTILAQGPAAKSTTPTVSAADDAAMLKQAKETQAPLMVEKTGLTVAQAEKIIEVNFEIRQAARSLKDLNEADRSAKIAELKALKEKKYSEFLTAEQIKTVYAYYEEMGKNRQPKAGS